MPALKFFIQRLLKRLHLYERAKASYLYDLFWRIADKQIIEARTREIEFYKGLLVGFQRGDLIFDIGANQGFKTDIFLRLGARVIAVDPDESNRTILEEKFLKHRVNAKPVSVVGKAVSDKNASETFWVDEPGSGKNTLNEKWVQILRNDSDRFGKALGFKDAIQVETISLETLISTYGLPFFIKIDTEGYEWNVLKGLQQPVPYLSFEVNLPEFKDEGLRCMELLTTIAPAGTFNYAIDSRPNLAAKRWLDQREFIRLYDNCAETSVEVFWKTVK